MHDVVTDRVREAGRNSGVVRDVDGVEEGELMRGHALGEIAATDGKNFQLPSGKNSFSTTVDLAAKLVDVGSLIIIAMMRGARGFSGAHVTRPPRCWRRLGRHAAERPVALQTLLDDHANDVGGARPTRRGDLLNVHLEPRVAAYSPSVSNLPFVHSVHLFQCCSF